MAGGVLGVAVVVCGLVSWCHCHGIHAPMPASSPVAAAAGQNSPVKATPDQPCKPGSSGAICLLRGNPSKAYNPVQGLIILTETWDCSSRPYTKLEVKISGLQNSSQQHGFHIHKTGNMDSGCEAMEGHYNPYRIVHGAPTDPSNRRHVGDLGNVQPDANGNVNTTLTDYLVTLHGHYSVIGRGIVLHAKRDDLGRGTVAGTLATGNAGYRLGCCVIQKLY